MAPPSDTAIPAADRAAPKARNPHTQAQTRRDTLWQILLPVTLAFIGAVILGVLVAVPGGAPVRSVWADISLILLIVPCMLLGLILVALVAGLAFAATYGLRELPYLLKRVQDMVAVLTYRTKVGASRVTDAVLSTQAFAAGVRKTMSNIRSMLSIGRLR